MKRTLFLISGWAHTYESLMPLAEKLSNDFSTRIVTIEDLRTPPPQTPDKPLSIYAANLHRLIKEDGQPYILGWSMGGMIAMETAIAYPALVNRLILIASTARFCSTDDFPCGIPAKNLRAMGLMLKANTLSLLKRFHSDVESPINDNNMSHMVTPNADDIDGLLNDLHYLQKFDCRDTVHHLTTPTLILQGDKDQIVSQDCAFDLNKRLPDSQLKIYEGTGHDVPNQHVEHITKDILHFLDNE